MSCHCRGLSWRVRVTPVWCSIRVSCSGVKIDGTKNAWALVARGMSSKAEGAGSDAVPSGEQMVGIALGNFNQDSTASYFKKQKLPHDILSRLYLLRFWHQKLALRTFSTSMTTTAPSRRPVMQI